MSAMSKQCQRRHHHERQPFVLILGCGKSVRQRRECQPHFQRHFFEGLEPLSSSNVKFCNPCSPSRFALSVPVEDRPESWHRQRKQRCTVALWLRSTLPFSRDSESCRGEGRVRDLPFCHLRLILSFLLQASKVTFVIARRLSRLERSARRHGEETITVPDYSSSTGSHVSPSSFPVSKSCREQECRESTVVK